MLKLCHKSKGSDQMDSPARVAQIFYKMLNGTHINLDEAANEYKKSKRTIKRDMTIIHRVVPKNSFRHDLKTDDYYLLQGDVLPFEQAFAIMKVLLGTRAFGKTEMAAIGQSLTSLVATKNQKDMTDMLSALKGGSYLPVNHDNNLIDRIQKLNQAIKQHRPIKFTYRDSNSKGHSYKENVGVPISLYFANYYFYVIIYRENSDDEKGNGITYVYRLDRFEKIKVMPRKQLEIPDDKRTDEESIRNKSYLLNSGNIISYEFIYRGYYPAALDQLPNSKVKKDAEGEIIKTADGGVIIYGRMFFNGAKMWVHGQGNKVTVKAPQSLITAVKDELQETLNSYQK